MTNAPADQNFVRARLACLNTDTVQGTNLVTIKQNPANGGIKVNTTSTISFTMTAIDPRDENYKPCWLFQGTDGLTYPAVADSSGALLVST